MVPMPVKLISRSVPNVNGKRCPRCKGSGTAGELGIKCMQCKGTGQCFDDED